MLKVWAGVLEPDKKKRHFFAIRVPERRTGAGSR